MDKRTIKFMAAMLAVVLAAACRGMAVDAAPESMKKSTYIIDPNGMGDFTTIQDGVNNASDGDTLIIYPGIYNEEVQVMNKQLDLVGISRDLCILQYDTASYRKAPLTMAAGKVSNLTIYGMDTKAVQVELTEQEIAEINAQLVGDSWDRQKNYKGYAVHVDQNFSFGRSITFDNCRIVSENNHCAGIGGRGKSVVNFENTELISLGGGSCIFLHDPTSADVSGEISLAVRSCTMTSYLCPYVMTFQSLMPEFNSMKLTFQNTRVSAVAFAQSQGYIPLNVNSFFDVETLMQFQDMGGLYMAGLSSPLAELVHKANPEDSRDYIIALENLLAKGNAFRALTMRLPEGITYLGSGAEAAAGPARHQVIAIYNRGNLPGGGWCGLDNAYLTSDSCGNTLPEMNAAAGFNSPDNAAGVSVLNAASGH